MLERMYAVLGEKFNDPVESWDRLVEFVAVDHNASLLTKLNHEFHWLLSDQVVVDRLSQLYDAELLRSAYHDHLGDLYREKLASTSLEADLDEGQVDLVLSRWKQQPRQTKRLAIADPEAGTGRVLMIVHKKLPEAVLFGVDNDLRALRIAMTNFAVHNIQGFLLHADKDYHDISLDTPEGQHNWQYANQWYSCKDKLKPRQHPTSLTH